MKKVVYIILLAIIFTSCGKYTEGPKISLKSRQKRIEGLWKVHKFSVNGIDSTSFFITNFGNNLDITKDKWEFPVNSTGMYSLSGNWNWYMFKYYTKFEVETLIVDNVQFNDTLIDVMGPLRLTNDIKWEIKRIFTSELFMETIYNDMVYRIELTLESDH